MLNDGELHFLQHFLWTKRNKRKLSRLLTVWKMIMMTVLKRKFLLLYFKRKRKKFLPDLRKSLLYNVTNKFFAANVTAETFCWQIQNVIYYI